MSEKPQVNSLQLNRSCANCTASIEVSGDVSMVLCASCQEQYEQVMVEVRIELQFHRDE